MRKKKCNHKDENGESTIIIGDTWFGVTPPIKLGVCGVCGKSLKLDLDGNIINNIKK
jgi:hypothetical protein